MSTGLQAVPTTQNGTRPDSKEKTAVTATTPPGTRRVRRGQTQPAESGHEGAGHLTLEGIRKEFRRKGGSPVVACDGIDLSVARGEFVVLLGPSGCGKTTLLRIIAGLDRPNDGVISIANQVVYDGSSRLTVPPEQRGVGMVFQSYALWPHMTVFDNVAYPLRAQKVKKDDIARRVQEVLTNVGVESTADRVPSQLSGGQQQRVALARALVGGSDIILFDEPLSNVDAKVRTQLREELISLHQRVRFTAVYVTHDQQEAMSLATRLLVLSEGRVAQDAPPAEVYQRPASLEVARFIGATDEFDGTVLGTDGAVVSVQTEIGVLRGLAAGDTATAPNTEVTAIVRPSAWRLSESETPGNNNLRGTVERTNFQGERIEVDVHVGAGTVQVWAPFYLGIEPGAEVTLSAAPTEVLLYER
jgi:iron(III) transport system ATP-binding protein